MTLNPELDLAHDFVEYTNRNIYLTGKAGTGKTTFLHNLLTNSPKRMVVVAPTGVAAINAKGVTIHSFFQMPFGPISPFAILDAQDEKSAYHPKFKKKKINLIKSMDLLVIDEISMVRADLLDAIDQILRKYKSRSLPFGGTQVLVIGDLQQLAPVVKNEEWNLLKDYYNTPFFFSSKVFKEANFIGIELKHIYRQKDKKFIDILNEIRDDRLSQRSLDELNKRYIADFKPAKEDGYINLNTHNKSVDEINSTELKTLKGKEKIFTAEVSGVFPENSYPIPKKLILKKDAQVMFVKNDVSFEKKYYNGKIGIVTNIGNDKITVKCKGDADEITVDKDIWENVKYDVDEKTAEITREVLGTFTQYPLRLAWAITVHKSQGLTFERAIIDVKGAFAHGQTYVALSRCKNLEGLVLSSKVSSNAVICDRIVNQFNKSLEENQPDKNVLQQSKTNFEHTLLISLFDYKQLNYHIERCIASLDDKESSVIGNLKDNLTQLHTDIYNNLIVVSQKFNSQLYRLVSANSMIEENEELQERIKKACVYFLDKTQNVIKYTIDHSSFETENYALEKEVTNRLVTINEIIGIKTDLLKSCSKGFRVKQFMTDRAKAIIKKTTTVIKPVKLASVEEETNHQELYRSLLSWRSEKAKELKVADQKIFPHKVIMELSKKLPTSKKELQEIKGVGKKIIENFGAEIITIIDDYSFLKRR